MSPICSVRIPNATELLQINSYKIFCTFHFLSIYLIAVIIVVSLPLSLPQGQGVTPIVLPYLHAYYPKLGSSQALEVVNELDAHQSSVFGKPIFLSLHVKYGWKRLSWSFYYVYPASVPFLWKLEWNNI